MLEREEEAIFARTWQYVGVLGEHNVVPGWAGRVPVVVVRDDEGAERAFVNVCRHRGSVVVEEAGSRKTLQCAYHAWTYGLDGSLRSGAPVGGALRRRRPRARRDPPRCLGPVPVREPGRRGAAARGRSRRGAGDAGRGRDRRRRPRVSPPGGLGGLGELEDRDRELPRVLPLRRRASRLLGNGRDLAGRVPARAQAVAPEPVRAAEGPELGRRCPRASSTSSGPTRGSTSSRAGPTSRSARSCRLPPTGPAGSSTTSSPRTRTAPGSPSSSSSTIRSGGRTLASWSRCSAAPGRAPSPTAGSYPRASSWSLRFRRGCPRPSRARRAAGRRPRPGPQRSGPRRSRSPSRRSRARRRPRRPRRGLRPTEASAR